MKVPILGYLVKSTNPTVFYIRLPSDISELYIIVVIKLYMPLSIFHPFPDSSIYFCIPYLFSAVFLMLD